MHDWQYSDLTTKRATARAFGPCRVAELLGRLSSGRGKDNFSRIAYRTIQQKQFRQKKHTNQARGGRKRSDFLDPFRRGVWQTDGQHGKGDGWKEGGGARNFTEFKEKRAGMLWVGVNRDGGKLLNRSSTVTR